MARRPRSVYVKQRLSENANAELKNKERTRQLYNYFYRKSCFFKASLYIRFITIFFGLYVVYFNKLILLSEQQEYVCDYDVEETHFTKRSDAKDHKSIYLTTTDSNRYVIDLLKAKEDEFEVGDTITVSRNVFWKRTYVTKLHHDNKNILVQLARCNNFLIFLIGFSLLSFMLKDGYDLFSRIIMRSVLLFDIAGFIFYFLS
ncbi:MAG: hypothetical protein JNJ40_04415 [Bacteroidia bacterium]|nr:hypothetical protein [Bacteroidia bacterium]